MEAAVTIGNKLSHPKEIQAINSQSVERAPGLIVDAIAALYHSIYKRIFPAASLGLQSQMDF